MTCTGKLPHAASLAHWKSTRIEIKKTQGPRLRVPGLEDKRRTNPPKQKGPPVHLPKKKKKTENAKNRKNTTKKETGTQN